jgi:N-acetylmuramoyl-L-alanine amidase
MSFSLLPQAMAAPVQVNSLRTWQAPDHTRLVFDLSGPVDYKLFNLENPSRLVVDIKNSTLMEALPDADKNDAYLKSIRSAMRDNKDLRVVLDLQGKSSYKSFLLKPYQQYGDRLVIDLYQAALRQKKVVKKEPPKSTDLRDLVIAIDAGHGGEDPGALGSSGTHEKEVVLAIARRLAKAIDKERGMRAVLIRDGDYYLSLRQRTVLARQHKADLFVSIHADAFDDRRVHGASVYILSHNGASDEAARWLAEKENSADLIGGVSLDDKDNMLASVLLDLSQNATIESSYNVAEQVLKALQPLGKLHKRHVQQAGFAVLKAPDMPSLLIESAFISNPREEKKLRSSSHQHAMSNAILKGVQAYFTAHAPPGTLYAAQRHVIARGDTLSEIARQYRVSLASLRSANQIRGNKVQIGQVLQIPLAEDS